MHSAKTPPLIFDFQNKERFCRDDAADMQEPNKAMGYQFGGQLDEPKTRTYHGRVGSGRPAERPGGLGQG